MLSLGRYCVKPKSQISFPNLNKALTRSNHHQLRCLTSYLVDIKNGPYPALVLGAAGLIPFASAPVGLLYCGLSQDVTPLIAQGQLAYGAVILSFLGGVRWGKLVTSGSSIVPSWGQFLWSVTPSLIAWPALMITSLPVSTSLVVAGLGLCGYLDIKQTGYQNWFKGLRLVLTTVAILSLLATLYLSCDLWKTIQ